MPRRLDAAETIDTATNFLHRLASDGWGLADIECHIEYQTVAAGSRKLPVEATVVIRLTPARG